jgi:hypothetical protein
MKIRNLFFSFALLAGTPLFARESTDVLIMKNGDRMTCEVKGLSGGVLSVSVAYVDGKVAVDWSKVARLESKQLFVLRTQDGSSYEGTLATAETPAGQPIKLSVSGHEGNQVEIERSKIVKMNQTSGKVSERFNGALSLGVIQSKGNTASQYNLGTDVQYLRERWAAQASLSSNLSSNSGSTTSTRNQVDLHGYHFLPRNKDLFYGGLDSFLQSSVQKISRQTTLGGGIGGFLKNTNRTRVAVLGGLGWQNTSYSQSTTQARQNLAAALIGAELNFFIFKKTRLEANAVLLPALTEPGRVHFTTNESYYLKVFGDLSWNLSFYGNWDNEPPPGFPGTDYGTSSGLSWTFGNR